MQDPRYVDVNGARTRYFQAGTGAPLILVHGGHFGSGGSAEDWEHNFDGLAQHFQVFALDKLGMGFTDNPAADDGYVIESHAEHLLGFMDAMGLERAHLVGHSRGGYAVTRLALDHPSRVDALIIVSSSSVTNPLNPVYDQWRQQAATMEERDAARYLIAANSYAEDHITERLVDLHVEIGRLDKTHEARRTMAAGAFDDFRTDLLQRVDKVKADIAAGGLVMPTLLLWGFDDPSATVDRCTKPAIDQFFPVVDDCEMHVIGHAGHYVFREQPDAFNHVLTDFIQRKATLGATAHA